MQSRRDHALPVARILRRAESIVRSIGAVRLLKVRDWLHAANDASDGLLPQVGDSRPVTNQR